MRCVPRCGSLWVAMQGSRWEVSVCRRISRRTAPLKPKDGLNGPPVARRGCGVGIPSASLGAGSSTPPTDSRCESVGCTLDDNLVGLKPGSLFKELNAALKRRSSTVPPTPLFHGTPNAALPRYPQRRSSAVLCAAVGRALLDWTAEGGCPHITGAISRFGKILSIGRNYTIGVM